MNSKDVHALVKKYIAGNVYLEQDQTYDMLAAYVMSTWSEIAVPANMQVLGDAASGNTTLIRTLERVTCWSIRAAEYSSAALIDRVREQHYATLYFDDPEQMIAVAALNKSNPFVFTTRAVLHGSWMGKQKLRGCYLVRMVTGSRFMTDEIVPKAQDVVDALTNWCGVEWLGDQRVSMDKIFMVVRA